MTDSNIKMHGAERDCSGAAARMEVLERFGILDTDRDVIFDGIADLAAALFDAPIAIVNFIAEDRQLFKAEIGIGAREMPLATSICAHALPEGDIFVVPDLTLDDRFASNPVVCVQGGVRFYAGFVLESGGVAIGAVCVLDHKPRPSGITDRQRTGLKALGTQTMAALERMAAARRDRFMLSLSEALLACEDGDDVMLVTARMIGEYLSVAQVGFGIADDAQPSVTVVQQWNDGRLPTIADRWRMDNLGVDRVASLKTGRTVLIDDIHEAQRDDDTVAMAYFVQVAIRSVLTVPLVRNGAFVAGLFVHHHEARSWRDDEVELVEDCASRAWGAVMRARADADIAARSRELEALIGTAPIGFAYFDRERRYLRINDELAAINGLPAADHIGVSIDALLPINAVTVSPIIDGVFATGKVAKTIEVTGDTPLLPGVERHWLTSWFPVFGEKSEIVSVGAWVVEITERRRAEDAQRASEHRLRQAQDLGGIGSWEWDHATGLGRVSESYRTLHAMHGDSGSFTDDQLFAVMHPRDKAAFRDAVKKGISSGERIVVEYRIICPDTGDVRWICGTGQRVGSAESSVTAGIVEDVTKRRASSALIQSQADEISAIFDAVPVGLCVFDRELRYRRVNERLAATSGVLAADHIGKTPRDLTPDLGDQAFAMRDRVLAGESILGAEFVGEKPDQPGVKRTWRENWVPMRDGNGEIIGIAVSSDEITKEKEAAEHLRLAIERAEIAQSAARAALYEFDPVLGLGMPSNNFQAITGHQHGATVSLEWWQSLVHPEDLAAFSQTLEAALKDVGSYAVEFRIRHHDGHWVWVADRGRAIATGDGGQHRLVGMIIDIDEQRRAQLALGESEARLRAVVNSAPVGLVFADATGQITGGNARVEEIIGHPVLPSPNVDAYDEWVSFHPDGRQVEAREYPLARIVSGEAERAELEVLYRRGDGRDAWIRFIATAVRSANGILLGGVVAALDIDREKRLTDQLEQEVEQAVAERDRLWATAEDLLMIARFDGIIVAVNPAWVATLGWTQAELVNTAVWELIHPDDFAAWEAEAAALTEGGKTGVRFESRYRAKDGAWHWLAWSVSSNGDFFNGVARDMTQDKLRQAELDAARAQLHEAQKLETIGQLTGGVAHDFNNLLTPIMGVLEMMERRVAGEERTSRLVSGALQSAERAKNLIQRLLAFARRQHLETKPVDLLVLIEGMRDLIDRSIGPTIAVEVALERSIHAVTADPNQLELALLNLAVNARDAMPAGGTLRFAARHVNLAHGSIPDLGAGSYICLQVSDTGSGMDADTIDRCIEPFYTTKGVGDGTGLGLSMVHGMMRQLGGTLNVLSELGAGTTMELWLPCSPDPAEQSVVGKTALTRAPRRSTILLVDDEALVRESTADMLDRLGYDVVQANGGVRALELLGTHTNIDALVTDYLMPGMTGRELAEHARRERPNLPVLLITGYTRLDEIGPDLARLEKPFRQAEFAARVAELVATE